MPLISVKGHFRKNIMANLNFVVINLEIKLKKLTSIM